MAVDRFPVNRQVLDGPVTRAFVITPHDDNDLGTVTRALWVGGTGNLSVIFAGDSAAVTITGIQSGTLLPFRVKRVRATSTTASAIVGLD